MRYLLAKWKILIIILLLNLSTSWSAEMTFKVHGKVYDATTGRKLAFANVFVKNQNIGTTTNENGEFRIKLAKGKYHLLCSYMGYKQKEIPIEITPGYRSIKIRILMEPMVLPGQQVEVSAAKDIPKIVTHEVKARELRNMTSPLPDVLVSLKTLPGVSSNNDQSSFYSVRGGNYDENLIYINGIEIFQPQLVRKGIAENPSLINPLMVKTINMQTGAFGVAYGDKLSSALDVTYGASDSKPYSVIMDVGTIGVNAVCSLQPNKKFNAQIGVRKIRYGYLFSSLPTTGNYIPDYQDVQARMNYRFSNKIATELFYITSKSSFTFEPKEWKYKDLLFTKYLNFHLIFKSKFSGYENYLFDTNVIGIRNVFDLTNSLKLGFTGSVYQQSESENTLLDEDILFRKYTVGNLYDPNESTLIDERTSRRNQAVESLFDLSMYSAKIQVNWQSNSVLNVAAGLEAKQFTVRDTLWQAESEISDSGDVFVNGAVNYDIHQSRNGAAVAPFMQLQYNPSDNMRFQAGIRYLRTTLNSERVLMPRIRFIWTLSPISEFMCAFGKYAQPPLHKEYEFSREASLKSQKMLLFTTAYQRTLQDGLLLKVEAYYKKLHDLISYNLRDVRIRYSGKNDANGYVYGMDVMFHGQFLPGTDNWISYSYMVARENIAGDNSGYIPRPTDRRHQFTLYMDDRMERLPMSKSHVRIVFGTGYPYTKTIWDFDKETNTFNLVRGGRNGKRFPVYTRFDIGLSQEFTIWNHAKLVLREEILNYFNHTNVLEYGWAINRKIDYYLGGRMYNIGMRLEF